MMKVHIEAGGTSPIYRLVKPLFQSIVMIAPERADQVRELIDDLTLVVRDTDRFVCRVSLTEKLMEVSIRTMEVVWAMSYAYFTFYGEVVAGKRITTSTIVDLTSGPLLRDAMALLRWSLRRVNPGPWPRELPAPEEAPVAESNSHVANKVAACAAAFLLHHELAHVRLGHHPTEDSALSIEQEREADYEAADWILGKAPKGQIFKRAFGITVGLVILVGRGVHYGYHDGETHPRTFDRLVFTLERYVADPGDTVWAFAMAVLKLHLDNARILVPDVVFDNPKDAVNAYVEALAAVGAP